MIKFANQLVSPHSAVVRNATTRSRWLLGSVGSVETAQRRWPILINEILWRELDACVYCDRKVPLCVHLCGIQIEITISFYFIFFDLSLGNTRISNKSPPPSCRMRIERRGERVKWTAASKWFVFMFKQTVRVAREHDICSVN